MASPNITEQLRDFYVEHKRMPSFREIADMCSFKSTNAVSKLIKRLERFGALERDESGRLVPIDFGIVAKEIWGGGIRVLGLVEAGFPSPAEEELADTMSLDEYLIPNKESSYMLQVKGDSMIEAGINDGDMVIVERNNSPRDGDIVIAYVDGGWTMKYFRKRGGKVYLDPANKEYTSIVPESEMRVEDIIKAVIRKY